MSDKLDQLNIAITVHNPVKDYKGSTTQNQHKLTLHD